MNETDLRMWNPFFSLHFLFKFGVLLKKKVMREGVPQGVSVVSERGSDVCR